MPLGHLPGGPSSSGRLDRTEARGAVARRRSDLSFAQVAAARGDADRAARLAGAALAFAGSAGFEPGAMTPFTAHPDDARAALRRASVAESPGRRAGISLDQAKPTPGLQPGTPSLRVKCSTS